MDIIEVKVGIADMKTVFSPNKIITVGLGSCVGIALFDKNNAIGGLVHIMLPDSSQFSNINNPIKFANLAIPCLINEMEKLGSIKRSMKAKIAGGASMFNFSDKSITMDIGNRNIISVKNTLVNLNIPIISEDVGGNKGRTMIFDTQNGLVTIKTVGIGIKEI